MRGNAENMKNFINILFIDAHSDDIEVGCGGFITKCVHPDYYTPQLWRLSGDYLQ